MSHTDPAGDNEAPRLIFPPSEQGWRGNSPLVGKRLGACFHLAEKRLINRKLKPPPAHPTVTDVKKCVHCWWESAELWSAGNFRLPRCTFRTSSFIGPAMFIGLVCLGKINSFETRPSDWAARPSTSQTVWWKTSRCHSLYACIASCLAESPAVTVASCVLLHTGSYLLLWPEH